MREGPTKRPQESGDWGIWGRCFGYVTLVNAWACEVEKGNSVVIREEIGVLMEFIEGWLAYFIFFT